MYSTRVPTSMRLSRAFLYGAQVFLSFFLMLVFMTYNVSSAFNTTSSCFQCSDTHVGVSDSGNGRRCRPRPFHLQFAHGRRCRASWFIKRKQGNGLPLNMCTVHSPPLSLSDIWKLCSPMISRYLGWRCIVKLDFHRTNTKISLDWEA